MRSIDPVLLSKVNNQYQTKANDAQPKMSVAVARARNTVMDNSYWVVESIRTGTGLGDVSLAPRRQRPNGVPDRIFEIHVQNGIVGTATKAYPDKLKQGWQNEFTLGAGSKVGIAFDGEWVRYRDIWRLVTHEEPWIFWVDGSNVLWTQLWDDETTKVQLATGVTYCRAIRAWKNLNIADKDQGIVIGYIKSDGLVYYRNYCQAIDLTYSWNVERQVAEFTGTAVNLNLFITNDYRMGFTVSDSLGDIYWYVTDRDWAGMAIAPEYIRASVSGPIDFIPITREYGYNTEYIEAIVSGEIALLYGSTYNSFISAENTAITMLDENEEEYQDYGYRVRVEFEHEVFNFDLTDLSLVDENSISYAISQATNIEGNIYELTTADMNNAIGDLILTFLGTGNTTGEAGQTFLTFDNVFAPTGLVPTLMPVPEVEVIWNE